MNLNLTLIGQMITFALFVWFTMKFVWPPLMKLMQERQQQIADGLAAAEQGQKELELAQRQRQEILTDAKAKASTIVEQATHRANHIVEESKKRARVEGDRLVQMAKSDAEQQYQAAKDQLMNQVSSLALVGAERILKREIDGQSNNDIIKELVDEI